MKYLLIAYLLTTFISCDVAFTSPGTYHEKSRVYCPDSSKYILNYEYRQGAWDGGRSYLITILKRTDSLNEAAIKQNSFSSYDIDKIYWQDNDTAIIVENFTEFISNGESRIKATHLNAVPVKIKQVDPIDTSYQQKIFYRAISPNDKYDLIVYKYVKPVNGDYFLNISVINKGDSVPKFGNFYVSRFNFDCFTDIRWDSTSMLDIKVYESCYYAFTDYLVKKRPDISYKVHINDTIKGNIREYMQ